MTAAIDFIDSVLVEGRELAGITLAGARINYGADAVDQAPTPTWAYLTLLSADAVPGLADDYPDATFGDAIPSGFVDDYQDIYEGATTRIIVGAPIVIRSTTPTGFTDYYAADYVSGFSSTRFTGVIGAVEYQPAAVNITAVDGSEALTRVKLLSGLWPAEPELDRVQRIADDAGIAIQLQGPSTATIAAGTNPDEQADVWTLLQKVASDCAALCYVNRLGVLIYRTRDAATGSSQVVLYPGATLTDDLGMTQEAGSIVNRALVTYGQDQDGVPLVEVAELPASIQRYGLREQAYAVALDQASAAAYAARIIQHYAWPTWWMPSATIAMRLAETAGGVFPDNIVGILDVDLDDVVFLPQLLPASPVPDYSSRVIGYVETLSETEWQLQLTLNPVGWTMRKPGDAPDYIPPVTPGPSRNPQMTPHAYGQLRVLNYDQNLAYIATPADGGSTADAVLDPDTGVYTLAKAAAAYAVTTTETDGQPGYMERKPYSFHQEDHGYWESYTITRDESYSARSEQTVVIGDPCVGGQCPPGWGCVSAPPNWDQRCHTTITTYHCDNGGSLEGTTCRKVITTTETRWVSNVVTVKDSTPTGFVDVFGEWVRYR